MIRSFLLSLLLLLAPQAWAETNPFPRVAKAYLVEIDGNPVWGKQTDRQLPQASLTKLMTSLLVMERANPSSVVEVSRAAARETGHRIRLRAGDRLRVEDLLAATLISSANDACHALADHVGGNEENFVRIMNKRAKELGLHDTHFQNACGHDHPDHYSTAADLATLANAVIAKNPDVFDLVAQSRTSIRDVRGRRAFILKNSNHLIGRYEGAMGLKTGFTPNAGKCLVAVAERGGKRVLLVLLNAPDRWWDAQDMLDLAFANVAPTS